MVKRKRSLSLTSSITDDDKFTQGDFTLISSDSVRFKISPHVLASASPVFADMISLSASNEAETEEVRLTDEAIESATTIRLFLNIVSPPRGFKLFKALPNELSKQALEFRRLTLFMDKYHSETGLAQLRLYESEAVLQRAAKPEKLFVMASITNDLALCCRILKKCKKYTWTKVDDTSLLTAHQHEYMFAPSHAPFEYACSLPFEYHWALTRAIAFSNPTVDCEKFCHKFVEIVQAVLAQTDHGRVQGPTFPPIVAEPNMEGYRKPEQQKVAGLP